MGLSLPAFLLLCCLTLTTGSDFLSGSEPSGRAAFVRGSNRASKITKRSLPAWLPFPQKHNIRKRSAPSDASCDALQGYETKLDNNTHRHTFNDLSGSVSLAWVGDGTGVMLALTTFQVPFFMIRLGQSKLYRSEDYGKTFLDVTDLINNTFIMSEFGIAIGPENSGKVILTGEVSGDHSSRIFVSSDFGKSFTHQELPFNPLVPIMYNPENSNVLLGLGNKDELWLTEDFGVNWKKIHDMVCLVKWGRKNAIFFSTNRNGSCDDRGELELRRTTDNGKTIATVATKIYSFGLGGRFLFASVMMGKGTLRKIHVSVDQGETWNMAQLPAVGHEQFYSILAASDEMVFMHVDDPGDTGFGTVYVSDDRGTVYSKSLARHLYTTTGGDTDFTNVTSLRGVFITSILAEDNSVQSVVSYDQGGEWSPIQKPANSKCDATAKDPEKCSLHIHAAYSTAMRLNVPMLPLSEPNALGLILAHASVGDAISVMNPDVYVSDDGGYTWIKALDGPHHYAILDSGGLLVAVEHNPNEPIDKIKFSTDEGQCWHSYTFTQEPIYFTGLASEPGARSMNVSIWGYKNSLLSQYWISTTIDFRDLLTRDCADSDYVQWLAHSDDISHPDDGCMLGYKEKFLRLKKDSVCWNGRDYMITTQPTPCQCTLDDFLCDFGYYRKEKSSECMEEPDLMGKVLEFCLHGKEEQLVTHGYRKIPGDKCEGGDIPERKEIDLSQRCVSDLWGPEFQKKGSSSKSVPIVITIVIIMLLSTVAGVFFVKKYVCGGRFLVHRYSVLQQHAEDNAADITDDPLDNDHAPNGKIEFHDDSDEDLLE
ncbi:sortilin 1b [Nerophis lumbriciformis]|uniref:sortilin 1b n=1 Tax=Nerophis lumbriciformis TaxID=546530 RepID=UPI002ADF7D16|nr:sortilin-like [Nerophis lumbriciformis]XP_061843652.1 sortilin-like [Nerophis lumbriciformis]XP_061843661.1 sortilin-like [Nerophis lumbriciformis]